MFFNLFSSWPLFQQISIGSTSICSMTSQVRFFSISVLVFSNQVSCCFELNIKLRMYRLNGSNSVSFIWKIWIFGLLWSKLHILHVAYKFWLLKIISQGVIVFFSIILENYLSEHLDSWDCSLIWILILRVNQWRKLI